jgi:hypothetical protein
MEGCLTSPVPTEFRHHWIDPPPSSLLARRSSQPSLSISAIATVEQCLKVVVIL